MQQLQERNLKVPDVNFAAKKLQQINYSRLSDYFAPFFEKPNLFKNHTTFEDILYLYNFDEDLKLLIFSHIKIIEVYLRSQISYNISENHGAFGYVNRGIYKDKSKCDISLERINSDVKRSKEDFVKQFFKEYDEKHLPVWTVVETLSFNTLSKIYASLNHDLQKKIAEPIKIQYQLFPSWFHSLVYIRNICAHHSRLWNRNLVIFPKIPKKSQLFQNVDSKKIYLIIGIMQHILSSIDDDNTINFKIKIEQLLTKYPNINPSAMGFVENWENSETWE